MKIRPEEVSSVIREKIEKFEMDTYTSEEGYVLTAGDGIAHVFGLDDCMSGELLEFEDGAYGMAMNLEEESIGCVLFGKGTSIREGTKVKRTNKTVEIPVGNGFIGRVINPLGRPLDGKGEIKSSGTRPVEFMAPGVIDRKSVDTPLQTGIMAIDSMVPIGRGQRELIIGDRQTGKTAIAVDAIINQKGKDVICVYVAIGQKASTVAGVVGMLEKHGAMRHTVVVVSTASDAPTVQYIAPYAGCAVAEYFMYSAHKDVLIVYDDLSKHAVAYRTLSLLLRRPPGREAYPGDVFYLHSRLLERAARLKDELGGGSITALPIIETFAGDVSAYIPTNVISITDGQIYLESELFFAGQRPAVNVGLSVSRVGGDAQLKAMKKVASSIRINLAQYRELAIFAQFGSDLDKSTKDLLTKGERLVEALKQPQYAPMPVEEQIVILFCATGSYLMEVPVNKILPFNKELIAFIKHKHPEVLEDIVTTGTLSDEEIRRLDNVIQEFKKDYTNGNG